MALDLLSNVVFSVVDFLKLAIMLAVPTYVFTAIGAWLKGKLCEKFKLSWLKGAAASTFAVFFVLLTALYLFPYVSAFGTETIGAVPEFAQATLDVVLLQGVLLVVRLLLIAALLALLVLPLELAGSYALEALRAKYPALNYYAALLVSVFAVSLLAVFLLLFVIPPIIGGDAVTGLVYLVFFLNVPCFHFSFEIFSQSVFFIVCVSYFWHV